MQAYNPAKVQAMLGALQAEAASTMLFLRSLEELEILAWHPGQAAPEPTFSCSLVNPQRLRPARQLFSQAARPQPPGQEVAGASVVHGLLACELRAASGAAAGRGGLVQALAGSQQAAAGPCVLKLHDPQACS